MNKVFPIFCFCVFAFLMSCNDKNATVKDQGNLVWAGNVDPICNMKVDESTEDTVHLEGKIYGFCCEGCKESFQEEPEKWLDKAEN